MELRTKTVSFYNTLAHYYITAEDQEAGRNLQKVPVSVVANTETHARRLVEEYMESGKSGWKLFSFTGITFLAGGHVLIPKEMLVPSVHCTDD